MILEPHMQLPPNVDLGKFPTSDSMDPQQLDLSSLSSVSKIIDQEDTDGRTDPSNTPVKLETFDDVSILFAPPEARNMVLT